MQENLKRRNHKEFGYAGCRSPSVVPFVRIFHWLLATAVLVNWATDEPLTWLGYLAGALVILRIGWGFIGPENAQFITFVRGPRPVLDFRRIGAVLVEALPRTQPGGRSDDRRAPDDRGDDRHRHGEPGGGPREGPLSGVISKVERPPIPGLRRPRLVMKQVHETVANITLVLVVLHLLGVALASFAQVKNLVRAMITGRKRAE